MDWAVSWLIECTCGRDREEQAEIIIEELEREWIENHSEKSKRWMEREIEKKDGNNGNGMGERNCQCNSINSSIRRTKCVEFVAVAFYLLA